MTLPDAHTASSDAPAQVSPYAHQSRGRRALSCLRALPHALRLYAIATRHVRQVEQAAAPQALPGVLQRLTPAVPASTWCGFGPPLLPEACLTMAYRLATRGRPHRCLPRALVLFGLLQRTTCTPVHFCLGVQRDRPHQHLAHAWVEVQGRAWGEPVDPHATHRLLYRYPNAS